MLTLLSIRNYAIVDHLDIELHSGMTVISGETGAGKSIMLDALGLALGDRASNDCVREGQTKAEITACFDLSKLPEARQWLAEHDLELDNECQLRRAITQEGRSRSYINGQPTPLAQVREFGQLLVDIHGQHEHHRLMKRDYHRTLLDEYAGQTQLADKVRQSYLNWQTLQQRLDTLQAKSEENSARFQLLTYQTEELDQLALQAGELAELENEQKTLANAGEILHSGHQMMDMLCDSDEGNCISLLTQCQHILSSIGIDHPALAQAADMLANAQIQLDESGREIRNYLDGVEMNPQRQQEVEDRLSTIYEIARKHRIDPDELISLHHNLHAELEELGGSDEQIEALQADTEKAQGLYFELASDLSAARQSAAEELSLAVDEQLHDSGMAAAHFAICLTPYKSSQCSAAGLEEIEFLISANKGQPARPLGKVASGGELSRISLAIQVVTAQTAATPTLIFDEVDVGIGGAIAEVVGRLLRGLGQRSQILCVTHQPQVASQGHQHLCVSKKHLTDTTVTQINTIHEEQRVHEIARMLGGIDITETSLSHAREMLRSA